MAGMLLSVFTLCAIFPLFRATDSHVVTVETPCNENKLEECKGQGYVNLGNDIIPILTATELDQMCQDWTESKTCLQNLRQDCKNHNETDHEVKIQVNQAITEFNKGRSFICEQENKQKFIDHALPCWEEENDTLATSGALCLEKYHNHTWFLNRKEKMNKFEFCKYANEYLNCQSETVSKTCGKKAGKWVSKYHDELWEAHMDNIKCAREKAGMETGAIVTIVVCASAVIYCILFSALGFVKENDKLKCQCIKKKKAGYEQAQMEAK